MIDKTNLPSWKLLKTKATRISLTSVSDGVKSSHLNSIANKGGYFEQDLLQRLIIRAINLENFACPKAKFLFDRLVWLETCGHRIGNHSHQHCPKIEVEAFGKWLCNRKEGKMWTERKHKNRFFSESQMLKEFKRRDCLLIKTFC